MKIRTLIASSLIASTACAPAHAGWVGKVYAVPIHSAHEHPGAAAHAPPSGYGVRPKTGPKAGTGAVRMAAMAGAATVTSAAAARLARNGVPHEAKGYAYGDDSGAFASRGALGGGGDFGGSGAGVTSAYAGDGGFDANVPLNSKFKIDNASVDEVFRENGDLRALALASGAAALAGLFSGDCRDNDGADSVPEAPKSGATKKALPQRVAQPKLQRVPAEETARMRPCLPMRHNDVYRSSCKRIPAVRDARGQLVAYPTAECLVAMQAGMPKGGVQLELTRSHSGQTYLSAGK